MEIGDDLHRPVPVFGATGGQGGAVAAALAQAGRAVRARVRDPASPAAAKHAAGAELAVAEFTGSGALAAAMRGTAAAFTLTTPFESGAAAEVRQGQAMIGAAVAARLPYLVFSSVAGATSGTGVPHFESKAAAGLPARYWIHAHTPALRRHYPTVGWTSFTAWAQRTFHTSDPAPQPDPS